jgi:hypothetical protein
MVTAARALKGRWKLAGGEIAQSDEMRVKVKSKLAHSKETNQGEFCQNVDSGADRSTYEGGRRMRYVVMPVFLHP